VPYGSDEKKGKEKNWCLRAMDVENNFTSSANRVVNEILSFRGNETQKITRRNNPLIKATLFWSRYESKRATGTGHYAWTSCRLQVVGKTTDALVWQYQGSYRPTFGSFKRNSTR
jgi:hypothetical protein